MITTSLSTLSRMATPQIKEENQLPPFVAPAMSAETVVKPLINASFISSQPNTSMAIVGGPLSPTTSSSLNGVQQQILPPLVNNFTPSSGFAVVSSAANQTPQGYSAAKSLVNDLSSIVFTTTTTTTMTATTTTNSAGASLTTTTPVVSQILDSVGSAECDWSVPYQTKLKYTQIFNATDKGRTGFVTGVQARHLMVETGLPHSVLAQIWRLADLDADGKLSCEEFVLAMHLCDVTKLGQTIVVPLPADLIPPSYRKHRRGTTDDIAAVVSSNVDSRRSSVTSPVNNQVSFEEKRKENFERGQIELNKRRQALLELQKQIEEDQKKVHHREENDVNDDSLNNKSDVGNLLLGGESTATEKNEQDDDAIIKREEERLRREQQKWLNQYENGLRQKYQSEQETISKLKDENKKQMNQFDELVRKTIHLTRSIDESRTSVSELKSVIDGMRVTRDTQMTAIMNLKSTLKKQNQQLIAINQEKSCLESKKKLSEQKNSDANHAARQDAAEVLCGKKKASLSQLHDKLKNLETRLTNAKCTLDDEKECLVVTNNGLQDMVVQCEQLYCYYTEKKAIVVTLRYSLLNTNQHWDQFTNDTTSDQWPTSSVASATTPADVVNASTDSLGGGASVIKVGKYRALYEFSPRNNDELSFQPGDIIMVLTENIA